MEATTGGSSSEVAGGQVGSFAVGRVGSQTVGVTPRSSLQVNGSPSAVTSHEGGMQGSTLGSWPGWQVTSGGAGVPPQAGVSAAGLSLPQTALVSGLLTQTTRLPAGPVTSVPW